MSTPSLRRAGTSIEAHDLWTACHALADDCTLVTSDTGEFEWVQHPQAIGTFAVNVRGLNHAPKVTIR